MNKLSQALIEALGEGATENKVYRLAEYMIKHVSSIGGGCVYQPLSIPVKIQYTKVTTATYPSTPFFKNGYQIVVDEDRLFTSSVKNEIEKLLKKASKIVEVPFHNNQKVEMRVVDFSSFSNEVSDKGAVFDYSLFLTGRISQFGRRLSSKISFNLDVPVNNKSIYGKQSIVESGEQSVAEMHSDKIYTELSVNLRNAFHVPEKANDSKPLLYVLAESITGRVTEPLDLTVSMEGYLYINSIYKIGDECLCG